MESNSDETVTAVVTTTTTENGSESISTETFSGTEAEVKAKIDAFNKANTDVDITIEKE
jgi:K(+)-stimulated pyrophosphate-energized sodium pump